jgi:hypothetical protein
MNYLEWLPFLETTGECKEETFCGQTSSSKRVFKNLKIEIENLLKSSIF